MNFENNWKKQAAAVLKDKESELAFMKLATRSVEDKASILLQQPYYLGFETVYSSKSHDKMIGIFGCRVGSNLVYIPVFYINGGIKGTDLLYLQNSKQFVLLTPEWCDFVVSKYTQEQGKSITDTDSAKATQEMDLRWLAYPPYMSKGASEKTIPLGETFNFHNTKVASIEEDMEITFSKFFDKSSIQDKKPLKRFIEREGFDAFQKIASAVYNDYEFANNIVTLLDQDEWCPEEFLKQANELEKESKEESIKTASDATDYSSLKDCILVHKGRFNPHTKCAAEQIEKGLTIDDRRDESKLDVVYNSEETNFKTLDPSHPGVYEILGADGTVKEFALFSGQSDGNVYPAILVDIKDKSILHYSNINEKDYADDYQYPRIGGIHNKGYDEKLFYSILGQPSDDKQWEDYVVKSPEPSKSNAYAIFLRPNGYPQYLSDECFKINNKYVKDGITYYDCIAFNGYYNAIDYTSKSPMKEFTIKVNPDAPKSNIEARVFRESDVYFIPVSIKPFSGDKETTLDQDAGEGSITTSPIEYEVVYSKFVPGTLEDYDLSIRSKFDVEKSGVQIKDDGTFILKLDGDTVKEAFCKTEATVKLMHDLNISLNDAEDILKQASEKGKFKFYHKKISRIRLRPEPDFYESTDSDLGVPIFNDGTKVVTTDEVVDDVPNPRFGDHAKPIMDSKNKASDEGLNDESAINEGSKEDNALLLTATPNMLARIAEQSGNKNIFEHGIIGTYAKTVDASSYINEFIPDLREGLDKLGRLYFLILWKPQSFLKYYGSDDLVELENNILSSFKQLGELTLELSLKTKDSLLNAVNNTID